MWRNDAQSFAFSLELFAFFVFVSLDWSLDTSSFDFFALSEAFVSFVSFPSLDFGFSEVLPLPFSLLSGLDASVYSGGTWALEAKERS